MRLPRFRLRIRTLLALVALVALVLIGQRVYRDGPEAHWLVLKLRYGNVEARRSAAIQIKQSEGAAMFQSLFAQVFSSSANPQGLEEHWRRQKRRAELLIPVLIQVTKDPDAGCRARALEALAVVVPQNASDSTKRLVLRQILAAMQDPDASVRTAAVGSLAGFAEQDMGAVLEAIRSALADSSVEVRQTAARELGNLGVLLPRSQPDAASILIPLLASREDPRVRVQAAWGMARFDQDYRRGAGPDVVPALVAALSDREVDVRRAAAIILGLTHPDAQGRAVSAWDQRKDSILPSLVAAISDADKAVWEDSALALFAMGRRDPAVIERIEQAARDPARPQKSRFESALKEWQTEREASDPLDPDPTEPD